MSNEPILERRDLGDHVYALSEGENIVLGIGPWASITLQPETQQALRRYMDDLQRAIEQRNVGPNASAQNAAYGANNAANKDQTK